jgi:Protein of unknown function (DUF1257)
VQNVKPRMYYDNQHGTCEYVLKLNDGPYDVGFDKQADGSYAPVFDDWQRNVANKVGASCPIPTSAEGRAQHSIGKLLQNYQKHVAVNAAVMNGYAVESSFVDDAGNVQITISA